MIELGLLICCGSLLIYAVITELRLRWLYKDMQEGFQWQRRQMDILHDLIKLRKLTDR